MSRVGKKASARLHKRRIAPKKSKESYTPADSLVGYLKEKLSIEKEKQLLQDAGKVISKELIDKAEANKRMKVYILDKVIFPSMANIVTFFEYVSKNPELQRSFDDDIQDLLLGSSDGGPIIFRRLLEGILTWHIDYQRKGKYLNFRAELYHTMLQIAFYHIPSILKRLGALPLQVVNPILTQDLGRAWGWTEVLRSRAPPYDNSEASRKVQF